MTMALCLNCGDLKWGAWCPCPTCNVSTSGNKDIDIAFSDHCIRTEQLDLLGDIIRQIKTHTEDPALQAKCFMRYVEKTPIPETQRGPKFGMYSLTTNYDEQQRQQVDLILEKLAPPRAGTGPKGLSNPKPLRAKDIGCLVILFLIAGWFVLSRLKLF